MHNIKANNPNLIDEYVIGKIAIQKQLTFQHEINNLHVMCELFVCFKLWVLKFNFLKKLEEIFELCKL